LPSARRGDCSLVDETTFRFDTVPPEVKAQLKVRDLTSGQEVLALPARDLFVMQTPSIEADYAGPPAGAFDRTGTRLVAIRDWPDCPMKDVQTKSMLPVLVPSCPDRRTTLSVWSLRSRKQVASTSIVRRQAEMADNSIGLAPTTSLFATRLPNSARATLDEADPPVVSFDGMATRVLKKSDGLVLEMTYTRRRVSLGLNQSAIEDACARLPGTLAHLNEATWTALVPAESYREICPSDASTSPDLNPIEQAFAKLKALFRSAAARTNITLRYWD